MDKLSLCLNISNELYSKFETVCQSLELTQENLLIIVKEAYELFSLKYEKKFGDFKTFITEAINEDVVISLGLEEIQEKIDETEINEIEANYIKTYEDRYNNIDFIISKGQGILSFEEKEILAAKNIPLIHSIVKHFSNTGIEYTELLSAGYVGYAKALDSFVKGKNVKFSTYAYKCIRNEILYFLRKEKRHKDNDVSLFKPLSTDKNGNVMTVDSTISTEDIGKKSVEDQVTTNETIKVMLEIIDNNLSDIESFIIKNRYGLDNKKPKTQKEIADEIGMSQANISKLEKGINDKIKKIMSSKYKIKSL